MIIIIIIRPVLIIFMLLVNRLHWKIGTAHEAIIVYSYSAEQLQLVLVIILWLENGHPDQKHECH